MISPFALRRDIIGPNIVKNPRTPVRINIHAIVPIVPQIGPSNNRHRTTQTMASRDELIIRERCHGRCNGAKHNFFDVEPASVEAVFGLAAIAEFAVCVGEEDVVDEVFDAVGASETDYYERVFRVDGDEAFLVGGGADEFDDVVGAGCCNVGTDVIDTAYYCVDGAVLVVVTVASSGILGEELEIVVECCGYVSIDDCWLGLH